MTTITSKQTRWLLNQAANFHDDGLHKLVVPNDQLLNAIMLEKIMSFHVQAKLLQKVCLWFLYCKQVFTYKIRLLSHKEQKYWMRSCCYTIKDLK